MPLGGSKVTDESVSCYNQILFLIIAINSQVKTIALVQPCSGKPSRRMTLSVIDILAERHRAYHGAEEWCVYWAEI
jgi:hypothetical protein